MSDASRTAEISIFARKTLGEIHGMLFGQFIELTGRCINGGLYDPESPLARPDGLRADVLEALRELQPSYLRYPGGCATAYFDWKELVGPVAERPRAKYFREKWSPQSPAFGIPEAWALCRELGTEFYLSVNAHTQTPEDAANLVEYLNGATPTKWADLRRAHGREEPYGVKYFGLGNEIYGDWQPGVKTAEDYVRWCREAIHQMKLVDPNIVTIACGLGRPDPQWDRTVIDGLIDRIDLISVHNYFGRPLFRDNMAASCICEQMLAQSDLSITEMLDRHLEVARRPGLAFDEWNIWYRERHGRDAVVEEVYNYTDALTAASLIHVILRHTGSIALANISELANVLGVLRTDRERCVRQTIFYPHVLLSRRHAGRVVETVTDGPTFSAKHERFFCGVVDPEKAKDPTLPSLVHFPQVPALDVLASIDDAARRMSVSVINKSEHEALDTRFDFHGVAPSGGTVTVHRLTGGDDLLAENTLDCPDRVGLATQTLPLAETFTFPPASLTLLEFTI